MTKSELLADLATKYESVESEILESADSPTGYNRYLVKVWDIADTRILSHNIRFYVYHEGLGDEEAYYEDEKPAPKDFLADVEEYIATIIGNNTIKAAYIEDIDLINETAILRVVINDYSEVKALATYDGSGDIQTDQMS